MCWLGTRLWYLHGWHTGDITVLHQFINWTHASPPLKISKFQGSLPAVEYLNRTNHDSRLLCNSWQALTKTFFNNIAKNRCKTFTELRHPQHPLGLRVWAYNENAQVCAKWRWNARDWCYWITQSRECNPVTPVECISLSFHTHPCVLAFITHFVYEQISDGSCLENLIYV